MLVVGCVGDREDCCSGVVVEVFGDEGVVIVCEHPVKCGVGLFLGECFVLGFIKGVEIEAFALA